MKMLVLAGGFGTRLQSVLSGLPKALAPVGNAPFLRFQLEHWIAQGMRDFVFLLHHQAQSIIDHLQQEKEGADVLRDCNVRCLVEPVPLGTGGAIAYAVGELRLTDDFLVCNADTWLGTGIQVAMHSEAPAITVVQLADTQRYGCVRLDGQGRIAAFMEKGGVAGPGWINAGLCHLNAEMFAAWDGKSFSLEHVMFPTLVEHGRLNAVELHTDFIDIGIPADYAKFCAWVAGGRKDALCA